MKNTILNALKDELLETVSAGSDTEDGNDATVTHVSSLQDQVRMYGDSLTTDAQKMTEKMEAYMTDANK